MLEKIRELPGRLCQHPAVSVTRNHGLERQVCESCGHVKVRLLDSGARGPELVGTVHHPRV
jgi:hypothetical protein